MTPDERASAGHGLVLHEVYVEVLASEAKRFVGVRQQSPEVGQFDHGLYQLPDGGAYEQKFEDRSAGQIWHQHSRKMNAPLSAFREGPEIERAFF